MNKKTTNTALLKGAGNAMKVQQHQLLSAEEQMMQMKEASDKLSCINNRNLDDLDALLAQAESLCAERGMDTSSLTEEDYNIGEKLSGINAVKAMDSTVSINKIQVVKFDESASWERYMEDISVYAKDHSLNLVPDPFASLLSQPQLDELADRVRQDYYAKKPEFDKYDYIIASFCGIAAGLIDSFFVGKPGESELGKWANDETDKFVIKLARLRGWKPDPENADKVGHAIAFFEDRYKVNYEQTTGKSVGNLLGMSPSNHHIKSLSHAPDIFGLIFSIVDQFCSTSHFLDNGRLIVVDTKTFELRGKNFFSKLFCGFCNWLGHLISDIAGSASGRKANPGLPGSGISIPFFELLQGVNAGAISCGDEKKTIADTAVKMFEQGYDARFGLAMSIPVAFNEFAVRLCWMLKQHYYHKQPWKKCIPIICIRELNDAESNVVVLRRMILASYGCLCLVDAGDAAIRSGGKIDLEFLLHINFIAWKKLAVNLALTGVMEVRLNYKSKHLDIKKLDKDLQDEWENLYKQISP